MYRRSLIRRGVTAVAGLSGLVAAARIAMNDGELPVAFGGPLRMRVPRQLGSKSIKFVNRIAVTDSLRGSARVSVHRRKPATRGTPVFKTCAA
jgi:DMSO/TMAO reductase YedYZ molybdopterin-dependent catalytic subunit